MRICFYTDQSISGMTGGIGRVTAVMTDYFRNHFGWKVYSIYAYPAKDDCILTDVDGSVCLRLHDRLSIRSDVRRNVKAAAEYLVKNDIDVLIVQTSLDVVAKIRERICNRDIKILSVLHFEPGRDEWIWGKGGIKGIFAPIRNAAIHNATVKAYRKAYIHGDGVFVLSDSYVEKYRKYAGLEGTDKLGVMPNPLSFVGQCGNVKKQKDVLVVARMEEEQKRLSVILRLWTYLQDEGYRLVFVGEGQSLPYYKELAKTLKLKNVFFEGRQNPEPYYVRSRMFLMTSSFEGFPMTIVEAQQYGCVPVAYDAFSALSDVVTDRRNGIIVANEDEKCFVECVKELMHDDLLFEELSENAKTDCMRFSQDIICNKWKMIIDKL